MIVETREAVRPTGRPGKMKRMLGALSQRIRSLTQTKKERRHALVGPAHLWKMKRDFQIRFLKNKNLKPEHYLLDIGCGTLRGGIPLIDYLQDGHYFGVEARAEVLEEGRKELREAGLEGKNPTLFVCPDISRFMIDREFNFIWAFSVLIHMSDEILNDTLAFVNKHLSEKGVFYANVNIGERPDSTWEGFPLVARTLEFYKQACAKHGLVVSDLGPLKDHGHVVKPVLDAGSEDSKRILRITKTGAPA